MKKKVVIFALVITALASVMSGCAAEHGYMGSHHFRGY
jgi:hypothetical protein